MSPDATTSRSTCLRESLRPFHGTAGLSTAMNHWGLGSGSIGFFER
ncbi:MAG: hypothetical protein AAFX50_08585 [Acidobacteriota bacterium]